MWQEMNAILSRTHCVQTHFGVGRVFMTGLKKSAGIRESHGLHSNVFFITSVKARSPSKTHEIQIRQASILATLFPVKPELIWQKDYSTTPSHIHIRCLFPLLIFLENVTICQSLWICRFDRCFSAQKWIYDYSSTYWNTLQKYLLYWATHTNCVHRWLALGI